MCQGLACWIEQKTPEVDFVDFLFSGAIPQPPTTAVSGLSWVGPNFVATARGMQLGVAA